MESFKTCTWCYITKSLSDFPKDKIYPDGHRANCKKCHTEYVVRKRILKKAELNPEKYMMCNDCDRIFNRKPSWNSIDDFKVCRFCKSENIENY